MTIWHEDRLLVDGELVPAEHGATYENIAPATEEVLGTAADASVGDTQRAIASARRAFDTTEWSRDRELRVRCLRQLHQALVDNFDNLGQILVNEVGAPVSSMSGPQLAGPTDVVAWYADLLEGYEFGEDLGERDTFAGATTGGSRRKPAVWWAPSPRTTTRSSSRSRSSRRARRRVHRGAEGGARYAVGGARARPADRRFDRYPARRRQRAFVARRGCGCRADDASRRRRRVVHRFHAGRPPDHGRRERDGEAGVPRARRQVGVRGARRR